MPEFAKGLILEVTDRDDFDEYIIEHGEDPAMHSECWGDNSVPKRLYIVEYTFETPSFYQVLYEHMNGVVTNDYINESLIDGMIEEGILDHTGNYDVEFVEENLN